jgi:DUF1365 family protein
MKKEALHKIFFGDVLHARLRPFEHRFTYKVFSVFLDIDDLAGRRSLAGFFGLNRFNILSFYEKDHGSGQVGNLRTWAEERLTSEGIETKPAKIHLLCYPRFFGYVFNPLSVYYCYADDGSLLALIYEVSNTFGEKHVYVGRVTAGKGEAGFARQKAEKVFHVSPFLDVDGAYKFRFNDPKAMDNTLKLSVQNVDKAGPRLHTQFDARGQELNTRTVLKGFFGYPLMTLKVIGAIHFEAFRIWRKGAKFHKKPMPPVHGQSSATSQ